MPKCYEETIYEIDPIENLRWKDFLDAHPSASVFHTPGWLLALKRTYRYKPMAFVDSPPGKEISSGQAFCLVDSWLTGKRLISVPFSDHAALLSQGAEHACLLMQELKSRVDRDHLRYAEIRPTGADFVESDGFCRANTFVSHSIALDQDLNEIFGNFHKDCVQRKIRRAEREGLTYLEGRSSELVEQFYRLLLLTNKRRGTPPQPIAWFRNLAECMGECMKIRIALKHDRPIASIVTLSFKKTMTYKYGCSDAKFHNLGAIPFLFWKTIQEAKTTGMQSFDLGRSDLDHFSLIAFKEHFGAQRESLNYWRYPSTPPLARSGWGFKSASAVLSIAPTAALRAIGTLLYRHVG